MLNPGPEFIVRAFILAWAAGDVEEALSFMHENVEWSMYIDSDVISFAGRSIGVEPMRARTTAMLKSWELLSFKFDNISLVGQTARVVLYADYRHKATGQILDLTLRAVFVVAGKKITRYDEYHDEQRIRAFMALVDAENEAKSKPGGDA